VHAFQVEINSSLLTTTSRDEVIARVSRGGIPDKAEANIAQIQRCLGEILAALPSLLTAIHVR
jgi:hypothetical protein